MFVGESFQVDGAIKKVEKYLKAELTDRHFKIYTMLFVENKGEDEVAKYLGYKTNEEGRSAGYKQIKNMRKFFKEKVIKILKSKDIIL